MPEPVYLVRLKSGVVVVHTKAEYERLWAGVDREAANLLGSDPGSVTPTPLSKAMNDLIATGEILPLVIAAPDGRRLFTVRANGSQEMQSEDAQEVIDILVKEILAASAISNALRSILNLDPEADIEHAKRIAFHALTRSAAPAGAERPQDPEAAGDES